MTTALFAMPPKHQQCADSNLNAARVEPGKPNIILADILWRFQNGNMVAEAQKGEHWHGPNVRAPYPVKYPWLKHYGLELRPTHRLYAQGLNAEQMITKVTS